MSARIGAGAAMHAARALAEQGWTTAGKMAAATWEQRTRTLNQAGYARYDESTSRMLGDTALMLLDKYRGDLRQLRVPPGAIPSASGCSQGIKGIGEVGADIFCREAQITWDELFPVADQRALEAASRETLIRSRRGGCMRLTSEALQDGQIPIRYSKDGQNISPPLAWSDLPTGTKQLALLFENITPQTQEPFVQWLVYGIPPDQGGLPEGYKHKADPKDPVDVLHGRNSLGNVGYDGPLGTLGRTIRYRFRLLALDQPLALPPGLDKEAFLAAASGHVLEQSDLIATYERGP